ncbi:MAG TPA: hypothetical protein VL088_11895, partial [Pedobacter sp.]|nr:hypothetical protein [Pedobacter sp.]
KSALNGNIEDGYSNLGTGSFNQWFHRDLDMNIVKELKDLTYPGVGGPLLNSWNIMNPTAYDPANPHSMFQSHYWYNMYAFQDLNTNINQRDRLYGSIYLTYKVNNDLKFTGTYRKNQNTTFSEGKTYSILERSGGSTGTKAFYSAANTYSNQEHYEFVANYNKMIKDFSIAALAGTDIFSEHSNSNSANTNNGLAIPDLFTVTNSVDAPSIGRGLSQNKYRAIFATANVGYKNFLFLDGTIRNDWFSTLPVKNNDVLSKSVGASFVFSEILPASIKGSWLSEAKLRASWGQIPQSIDPYLYPGASYGVNTLKWNGNLLMNTPDRLVDEEIHGAVQSAKEIGLDLKMFNRRLNISATLWDKSEDGFPLSVGINATSGFSSVLTNIGKINKKGIELQLGADPIRLPNFTWNVSATYSRMYNNKIIEISDKYGIKTLNADDGISFGLPRGVHRQGEQWGQLFGNGWLTNDAGVPILDANGLYQQKPGGKSFGSILPKYFGGIQNSFTIFNMFDVNANIDYSIGGKFSSLSNMWGSYSGLTARTATINDKGMSVRDAVADGGGVRVDGVDAANKPVTFYVPAQTYYSNFQSRSIWDPYVYDLTFVKLREVSVAYRIPVKKLGMQKFLQSATFSIIARNPLIIYAKTKDFDPAEIATVSGENAQLPSSRGVGFNLRIGF